MSQPLTTTGRREFLQASFASLATAGFGSEAMAMQKPVVATQVGGVPEIIQHGHNGFLVAPQDDERFGTLITVFKRAFNICTSAGMASGGGDGPEESLFESDAESHLFRVYKDTQTKFRGHIESLDFHGALAILLELAGPINVFFDEVMVMAEDERLRENRLNLLGMINNIFLEIADFSKITT